MPAPIPFDARNIRRGDEFNPGNGEGVAIFFESHIRVGTNVSRRELSTRQLRCQRHRETPGVRCAKQLLRVRRRLAVLETRSDRIWDVERSATDREPSASVEQISFPFRLRPPL